MMAIIDEYWSITRLAIGDDRLSIILPLYHLVSEAKNNLTIVADIFEKQRIPVELIPVDDGSNDGTDKILSEMFCKWEYVVVKPVICKRNGGKGAALRAGFNASSGKYIMLLDGDLDIHPMQTPYFFKELVEHNADIVVGSKRHPNSKVQYPWHRRVVSFVYFTLVKLLVGLKITDTQTGMKLFKRDILKYALDRMLVKTYAFDLELLSIAAGNGAKIVEAPVVIRFGNKFGALHPKTVWQMTKDTLAVFYRLRLLRYYQRCLVPQYLDHEPLISIIIACPRSSKMLEECLATIRAQSYEKWECIVLPDEEITCSINKIQIISTGKVRPAEKRNIGINAAKGEIVAFIDDDAYPDVHWLEYAVKYFGEKDIGAVGGPGITPSGDSFMAKIGGRVYENLLVGGSYRYRYVAGGVRRDVDDYPSCNLFVRKDLLKTIGGFRTDFWPGEDTLLCKDIIDNGYRIVYDPWIVVNHHRRALFMPHIRQIGRYAFHRGYFCKRYPSNSLKLAYFAPTMVVFSFLLAWLSVVPLMIYLIIVLLSAFSFNPIVWLMTTLGIVISHLTYGVRFVVGLCAAKAPCEYIGKDHGNGK